MALRSPANPPLPDNRYRSSSAFHEEMQAPFSSFHSPHERAVSSPQPTELPSQHIPQYIIASPDLHTTVLTAHGPGSYQGHSTLTFKPEGSHSHSHTSSLSNPGSSSPRSAPCSSPSALSVPIASLLSHPGLPLKHNPIWPPHGLPSAKTSVNAAYLEARRVIALRASQAESSGGAHPAESEEEDSESETEHDQVTKLLLAAVLSSEKSKAQHARHHSWSHARHQAQSHRGPSRLSSDLPPTPQHPNEDDAEEEGSRNTSPPARVRSSYHLTSGQAAVELFLRLSHARQTVDFSKRQAALFSTSSHAVMTAWEALEMLNELREFEAVLLRAPDSSVAQGPPRTISMAGGTPMVDMTLTEHAFQTAELCRIHYGPDKDYMHLAGLLHGLGKLLAHARFGTQPQWAVCGESFPCGCRFAPGIQGAQYFSANSDRRRRLYNTQCGMYPPQCGLSHVTMSWGAAEYLYQVLQRNHCKLPPEAMFCLRFQKFFTLADGAYNHLLDAEDRALLPSLATFQHLCDFKRRSAPGMVKDRDQLHAYYSRLMAKYLPDRLNW